MLHATAALEAMAYRDRARARRLSLAFRPPDSVVRHERRVSPAWSAIPLSLWPSLLSCASCCVVILPVLLPHRLRPFYLAVSLSLLSLLPCRKAIWVGPASWSRLDQVRSGAKPDEACETESSISTRRFGYALNLISVYSIHGLLSATRVFR